MYTHTCTSLGPQSCERGVNTLPSNHTSSFEHDRAKFNFNMFNKKLARNPHFDLHFLYEIVFQ